VRDSPNRFPLAEYKVIPNPSGEAHVPALPKIAQVARQVRRLKLIISSKPRIFANPRDVRIAGKVTVDLQRKSVVPRIRIGNDGTA